MFGRDVDDDTASWSRPARGVWASPNAATALPERIRAPVAKVDSLTRMLEIVDWYLLNQLQVNLHLRNKLHNRQEVQQERKKKLSKMSLFSLQELQLKGRKISFTDR